MIRTLVTRDAPAVRRMLTLHLLALAVLLALSVLGPLVSAAWAQKCEQAVDISGFNKLIGTLWGYTAGPAGKMVALALLVFGAASIITRHVGLGVGALVAAFVIAFAATIVNTLFSSAGITPC